MEDIDKIKFIPYLYVSCFSIDFSSEDQTMHEVDRYGIVLGLAIVTLGVSLTFIAGIPMVVPLFVYGLGGIIAHNIHVESVTGKLRDRQKRLEERIAELENAAAHAVQVD